MSDINEAPERLDAYDIVDDLRDWSTIIDEWGRAVVSRSSGRIFADAADEIERLRALVEEARHER